MGELMRRLPNLSLENVETILQYSFRDRHILEEALLAPSRVRDEETGSEKRHHGNRSLATIGRHLLAVIVANSARELDFAPRKDK